MTKEKIQDVTNDISENMENETMKTEKVAEDISSDGKSFLETQLDTFTEMTNIAVEGVEKMVELNMEVIKESVDGSMVATEKLLATTGNAGNEKIENATEDAVDAAKMNVAKTADKAREAEKNSNIKIK